LGANSEVLVQQSYSQDYEMEADAAGWDYLVKARIDPRGLISLLRKFEAEQDQIKKFRPAVQALSSHPSTAKRIRVLESKWSKLKDKSGFIQFKEDTPG
jgi:predicted Zn-dependent protease